MISNYSIDQDRLFLYLGVGQAIEVVLAVEVGQQEGFGDKSVTAEAGLTNGYYCSGVSWYSASGGGGIRSDSMTTLWITLAVVPTLFPL